MPSTTILSDNGVSSGTAGLKTTGGNDGTLLLQTTTAGGTATTAMTIDTSQNVGIGTTSPTDSGSYGRALDVNGTTGAAIYARTNGSATNYALIGSYGSDGYCANRGAGNLIFQNNNNERMRIDSSGNLLVGINAQQSTERLNVTTSVGTGYSNLYIRSTNTSYGGSFALFSIASATSGAYEFLRMFTSTQEVFRISGNGNVTNINNSYGPLSDIKLKENIVDATPKLADLMRVRIVNYNLKENPELKQIGVIAQELEQVFPGLVDNMRDTDSEGNDLGTTTKSVKMSVFVPMLIKAIQELNAKVEAQAAEIAALKGAQ